MMHRIERDELCFYSEPNYRHMQELLKEAEAARKHLVMRRWTWAISGLVCIGSWWAILHWAGVL